MIDGYTAEPSFRFRQQLLLPDQPYASLPCFPDDYFKRDLKRGEKDRPHGEGPRPDRGGWPGGALYVI